MSIITKKSYFKLAMLLSLLVVSLYSTSAFAAVKKISIAKVVNGSVTEGDYINIWDGSATMTMDVSSIGKPTGVIATFDGEIRKSNLSIIPDTIAFQKTFTSAGTKTFDAYIKERGTYYADAAAPFGGTGTVTVKSEDESW